VIDLDHFKAVNDSMGHSTGDALLKVVAVRLSACVRPTDVVARLGGDEFAMLVTSACGPDEALHLAQRVVAALQEPCEASGRLLRVGASVGVALLPEHGHSADQLFGHADLALYEAKEQGRGRSVVFSARLGDRSRRRVDLELGLRRALDRGEMAVHWQPQVDIRHWRVAGAEALLRWQHPQLGAVGPSEFVAVAESCGLIEELGHWVLDQACRTAATRLQGLSVSVNVSAAQLRDERFAEHVRAALHAHQLDPSRLELEITESIFIDDAQGAIQRLQALRELGVRIGLDDFGTGYSSLAYLRRFPFDTLKIDRAFVSELLLRGDAQAIVRTITQLAGALGMRTVAEGVETEAQLAVVEQTGCNQVQGYLVSPPLHAGRVRGAAPGLAGAARQQPAAALTLDVSRWLTAVQLTRPSATAKRVRLATSCRSSRAMSSLRWYSTVFTLTPSWRAISLFDSPRARCTSTSRWRGVSRAAPWPSPACRRAASDGLSQRWPRITSASACVSSSNTKSLHMKPAAPQRSAVRTTSGSQRPDSTSTRRAGHSSCSARSRSRPGRSLLAGELSRGPRGRCRSSSTRSGRRLRQACRPSAVLPAAPTHTWPGMLSTSAAMPALTSTWSSITSTRWICPLDTFSSCTLCPMRGLSADLAAVQAVP
jgi:diguanylate cyclase (GGDEF)-like protein